MKFILIYNLLTIIIARDNCVEGAGNLSENELKFIADRLYPAECSQLLSYLPGARGTSRTRASEHLGYRGYEWITENSRAQCLESLYECNQRGRALGCTRNWLEAALHKLGRADLASRLKKTKDEMKANRKNSSRKSKTPRTGRDDKEFGKNHKHYSRKKAVTSGARDAIKNNGHKNNDTEFLLGNRFIAFVAAGSILVLVFLGCIVIVSYRRACRCYKNYLHFDNAERNEKRESSEKLSGSFEESINKSRRSTIIEAREFADAKKEHARLVLESDKGINDTPNVRRSKIVSFDSGTDTDEEECNCSPEDAKTKISLWPCARIKRFFDSQKRHLRGTTENTFVDSKRKKLRNNGGEIAVAKKTVTRDETFAKMLRNARKKRKKCASARGKRTNRDRRFVKSVQSSRKDTEKTKPIGCTCQMCKLFNIASERESNKKTFKELNKRI